MRFFSNFAQNPASHDLIMCPTCALHVPRGIEPLAAKQWVGFWPFVSRIAAFDDEGVLRISEASTAVTYDTIGDGGVGGLAATSLPAHDQRYLTGVSCLPA